MIKQLWRFSFNGDLDGVDKGKITPSYLPRLNILNLLVPVALSSSLVFAGQEVHLHGDFTVTSSHLPKKDKGLFPLYISSPQKQLLDCFLSFGIDGSMVQSEIDIDAADMGPIPVGQKELGNPATDEHETLPV